MYKHQQVFNIVWINSGLDGLDDLDDLDDLDELNKLGGGLIMNQIIFNSLVGSLASIISYAFGGWDDLLSFFLFVVVLDYISGVGASLKEGKGLSSEVGFWGLFRKILMIILIALAHRADVLIGTHYLMTGAIYFYLANELISVTENYGRLGLPLPDHIRKLITVLKKHDRE